jgi:carboxylesterase
MLVVLFLPLTPRGLGARPNPARTYAEALRRVAALQAKDSERIAPDCRTRVYTHGARTGRVIVMFHGLTNCPAQFDSLARVAYARGANVLVPRLPRHGYADRMTDELGRSDARELRAFADRVIDAASGLGDTMTVVGLSVGGTLAAWAAQERREVARAVVIAPMIGVAKAPGVLTPVVARLTALLPNLQVWWDAKRKLDLPGPKHVYPRFATRAIAATLLMGAETMQAARRESPEVRSAEFITVGKDPAVDNGATAQLARLWERARPVVRVTRYQFPDSLRLNHDVVDPEQFGSDPARTYPVLIRAITP